MSGPARTPQLVEVRKIWDAAPHNAFTDLARYRGSWYCCFREASGHLHGRGRIRIIVSPDGRRFESCALFAERGVDLRDPKLSVTPDNRLMLLAGGTRFSGGEYAGRRPRVRFSTDGESWGPSMPVMEEGDWLWRVTWHQGRAWGVSYRLKDSRTWIIELVSSRDGIHYAPVTRLKVSGKPNEATLRFRGDGQALLLVRREGGDRDGVIGTAGPPYTAWEWHSARSRLGGPNFLVLANGDAWASGRQVTGQGGRQVTGQGGRGTAGLQARTILARLGPADYEPVLELPSGGDCSYPGMVYYHGRLWMSYYSSHEGQTSIYLAIVRFTTEK